MSDINLEFEKKLKKRAFQLYKKHVTGRGYVWPVGCTMPDDVQAAIIEGMRESHCAAPPAPVAIPTGWISVNDQLPGEDAVVLAWVIEPKSIYGGYREIVCYGKFDYITDEDEKHLHGWHYERESEGDFDWLTFDFNGKVSHWIPLPAAPECAAQPAENTEAEKTADGITELCKCHSACNCVGVANCKFPTGSDT